MLVKVQMFLNKNEIKFKNDKKCFIKYIKIFKAIFEKFKK